MNANNHRLDCFKHENIMLHFPLKNVSIDDEEKDKFIQTVYLRKEIFYVKISESDESKKAEDYK